MFQSRFSMRLLSIAALSLLGLHTVDAFDISSNSNLVVYWGQNSYGDSHPNDASKWQQSLDYYCNDNTVDMFPIAFLNNFTATGGLPSINLANSCAGPYFPGTALLNCTFMASQISACQAAGKAITLSLGGDTCIPNMQSDADGQAFAHTIWNLFLGGTSTTRPFGTAVLDGIDLDIEGGTQTGFNAFLTTLRGLMDGGSKQYYITAAPHCAYPDSTISNTLNAFSFDAIFVQFYNNWCGLNNYQNSNDWDFGTWDNWAKNTSPNKNVKVYIGASASPTAATSGYVNASMMSNIISATRSEYSSFGGVMLWDMSEAYANSRYDAAVTNALKSGV